MRATVFAIVILCAAAAARPSAADITLSGTQYFQNFDGIGTALPSGVTVSTGATASSLGTAR